MNVVPFRLLMGVAISMFGWSSDMFWKATPHAFLAALEEHRRRNDPEYASRLRFAEFKEEVENSA